MKASELLELNPLLSDRVRLAIMGALLVAEGPINFSQLAESLGLTKGNLSAHIRKLEEDGLVGVTKEFVDRKPCTSYRCTAKGRAEMQKYLEQVERLLKQAKGSGK